MSERWKGWTGRTVDGRFPMQTYLGGSEHSAVFLTTPAQRGKGEAEKAAIKIVLANPLFAEKQLLRWEAASKLTHPNLIRIFEAGHTELDSTELLYVVEEYAEENLSQVLSERALTVEEVRGMLPPVLQALQFLHEKGYVHGHIRPSNVLAIEDRVKLSSDTLTVPDDGMGAAVTSAYDPPEAGSVAPSAAADVWQLGMMLNEVLARHLPGWDAPRQQARVRDGVPQPFADIIENCLRLDPASRWTVAQIADRLEERQPKEGRPKERQPKAPFVLPTAAPIATPAAISASAPGGGHGTRSAKWPYAIALIALIAIVAFLASRTKPSSPPPAVPSKMAEPEVAADRSQPAQSSPASMPRPAASDAKDEPAGRTGDEVPSADAGESGIVHRVIPQVQPSARRTVQGKIKVRVKVEVDAAGDVAKARLESAGPSKYFSRIALQAAREWKFAPAQAGQSPAAREWNLQFSFTRTKADASATRARR